jgi:hypothetical protein
MSEATDPARRLHGDLRAQARHGDLVTSLGQPRTAPEGELTVMLARYLDDTEVTVLTGMVVAAVTAALEPMRALLGEVADVVAEGVEKTKGALNLGFVVEFPATLARRVLVAANRTGGQS